MYMYVCMCMYACMHVCMYAYIYIYIYIYNAPPHEIATRACSRAWQPELSQRSARVMRGRR